MAEPGARDRMIDGAAVLLAKRGLQGASFSEVLEATGAPRGSIYHHFPGGKDELVAAAIARVSERTLARLTELGGSATNLTEGFLGLWRALLDRSGLTAGCAVVAVSVAASDDLLDRAGTVFREWTAQLAALLEEAESPRPGRVVRRPPHLGHRGRRGHGPGAARPRPVRERGGHADGVRARPRRRRGA